MVGTLAEIHIYPVKSCRSVALEQAEVAGTGLKGDRLFQVVDVEGNPVTQRQQAVLATVQPAITTEGLSLEVDGRRTLHVAVPTVNDTKANSLLGVPVDAGDFGDEASACSPICSACRLGSSR